MKKIIPFLILSIIASNPVLSLAATYEDVTISVLDSPEPPPPSNEEEITITVLDAEEILPPNQEDVTITVVDAPWEPTRSIKINNNAPYTDSISVLLTLSAQDNPDGPGIAQMQFSNDNSNWSIPEAYAATKDWILTNGNGVKTVYARFSSQIGGWSDSVTDEITLDTSANSEEKKAYTFLYEAMDRYKSGEQIRLIESYTRMEHSGNYPPSQEGVAWVYDNALAIIALVNRGYEQDIKRARILCEALIVCQEKDFYKDGRIRDAYYANKDIVYWAAESGSSAGNMAWAINSLLQYYRFSQDPDKDFLAKVLNSAKKIGNFVASRYPDAINTGFKLAYDWDVKSTENNISLYPAFRQLYEVTQDSYWKQMANWAAVFVTTYMFDGNKFFIGSKADGLTKNEMDVGDVNSWGVLVFGERYKAALTWAENKFSSRHDGFTGFDFNADKDGVWFEGTAHMALAYKFVGEEEKANLYLTQLKLAQTTAKNNNGKGITAACHDDLSTGFNWGYYPSLHIGATSWFLAAQRGFNMMYGGKISRAKIIANAGLGQIVNIGETINFDASNSLSDAQIVSYEWDFGDGEKAAGRTAAHKYNKVGLYEVVLSIKDTQGKSASDSCYIMVRTIDDIILPEVRITSPKQYARLEDRFINIQAEASDNVGVAKVDFYVDNIIRFTDIIPPYIYPCDVYDNIGSGPKILQAVAYDTSGNTQVSKINVTINDSSDSLTNGDIEINQATQYTNKREVVLYLTPPGGGNGAGIKMKFSPVNPYDDDSQWTEPEDFVPTKPWILSAGDDRKFAYVSYKDSRPYWLNPIHDSIVLDTLAPTTTHEITDTDMIEIRLRTNDGAYPSGIENTFYSLNGSYPTVFYTGTIYIPREKALTYTLRYYSVDNAGNVEPVSLPVPIDKTSPTGSLKINNDAVYTNSLSVTLNLSAEDNTGGSGMNKMKFSNDNSNWSGGQNYAATANWTLDPGDGKKTVYVKFSDKAGNWSEAYFDSIILDKTPPEIIITKPQDGAIIPNDDN